MSDEEKKVECGVHGTSAATFLCRHLNDGEGQGFNVGYDPEHPDNLYPDAWCDQCDAVLEQEGEWNDRAEAFAGIRLVCAECYCHIRELNWLQDEDMLHALITDSFNYLQEQQNSFMATYKIGAIAMPLPAAMAHAGSVVLGGVLGQIALGRFGEPADIARAVAFLAGPSAAYITGETLHVNGGMYMP